MVSAGAQKKLGTITDISYMIAQVFTETKSLLQDEKRKKKKKKSINTGRRRKISMRPSEEAGLARKAQRHQ